MPRMFPAIGCLIFILGCGSAPTSPSDPSLSELSSAPTRIVVDGRTMMLSTALYRDFMPIAPPDGRPLAGVLRITTDDGSPVPAGVMADTAWVIYNGEVWSTSVEQRARAETAPHYEVIVRGGPKWGPNVAVDVVARLRDSRARVLLLGAREQTISATQ